MALKEELAGILKPEYILDDPDTLENYSKDSSFAKSMKPRIVVKPQNADDVQAIVRWANKTKTALVPVSSGPPHFRGDTVPSVPGAVIVDLSGFKKVIKIDRRNRVAIIESGVTYPELQSELSKEGLEIPTPLIPRKNKSVVASLLEREPVTTPRTQWSFYGPLRSLELVWGDGVKFVTGDAGNWHSFEKAYAAGQSPISPNGPVQTDFHKFVSAAQGSMGIITWGVVRCEVVPEVQKLFFVPSKKIEDVIDFTYKILRIRFGDELFILNSQCLASILGTDSESIKDLSMALPPWIVMVGIAGRNVLPEERVDYQEKDITEIAQQMGLEFVPEIPGARNKDITSAVLNPSNEPYWKLNHKGGCQDIFFITTLEKTPVFTKAMYSIADEVGYPTSDIGIYVQPVHQGASCHCEFNIPYDPDNQKETEMAKDLYIKATEKMFQQGAFFSRPYDIWAPMAFNRDMRTTVVLKKIKDIFDPNNIMNPGKLCF